VRVDVITHPLVADRLAVMRNVTTAPDRFRAALADLARMLVYEATRELPVRAVTVPTPLAPAPGGALDVEVVFVPVLRAGLGMLEAAFDLIPTASAGFVGLARDETTFRPGVYLESLPADLSGQQVVVLDPMLATGGSALHTLRLLAARGAAAVILVVAVAAPEGVAALEESGLDVRVVAAAVDHRLNADAYIVPGLGDAGDRQFGAV
jgi:uracil phosphoribosyltransferase